MIRLILILLTPGALLLVGAFRPAGWVRRLSQNLLISYVFIVLMLVGGELYFRYNFAQSENILTKATANWLDRYWQTNALGFRDLDWTPTDWDGKTTVMIAGDSFAAGWGIENPQDRFGDVLAARLGDDYAVLNVAEYGRSTPEQLEIIQNHPLQNPDVILLQYYLNDISYAQLRIGAQLDAGAAPWWANDSYLLNFMYHRVYIPLFTVRVDWVAYDYAAYDNPLIWDIHREEIEEFIDYTESIDARLIVVIFPNMIDPIRSIPYVDRVAAVFEGRNIPVLKLFDQVNAWALEERIVSNRDTHPSPAFHRMVGELIYDQFFAE